MMARVEGVKIIIAIGTGAVHIVCPLRGNSLPCFVTGLKTFPNKLVARMFPDMTPLEHKPRLTGTTLRKLLGTDEQNNIMSAAHVSVYFSNL